MLEDEKVYEKSTAIIKILLKCTIKLKMVAYFLMLIPKPIRDFGYSIFSKNRKLLFKPNQCSIKDKAFLNNRLIHTL